MLNPCPLASPSPSPTRPALSICKFHVSKGTHLLTLAFLLHSTHRIHSRGLDAPVMRSQTTARCCYPPLQFLLAPPHVLDGRLASHPSAHSYSHPPPTHRLLATEEKDVADPLTAVILEATPSFHHTVLEGWIHVVVEWLLPPSFLSQSILIIGNSPSLGRE